MESRNNFIVALGFTYDLIVAFVIRNTLIGVTFLFPAIKCAINMRRTKPWWFKVILKPWEEMGWFISAV